MIHQVVCWVLGEYGTADGSHSADYIIGKLCDVAEAHPGDFVVKVSAPASCFAVLLSHFYMGSTMANTSSFCHQE